MKLLRRAAVVLFFACWAGASFADVPANRDEFNLNARTVLGIVGFAMVGGLVSFIAKVQRKQIAAFSLMALVGELCTSAFAGFLCYLLCDSMGWNVKLTIGLVGIAGHMGTRSIAAFENFAARRWGALAGGSEPADNGKA